MNRKRENIWRFEKEIATQLAKQKKSNTSAPDKTSIPYDMKDFVVRQIGNLWEVGFTYRNSEDGKFLAKHGEARQFKELSGVGKWMTKMGIKEFKVVLE